jgi:DNA recombination protein RmuC
MVVRLPGGQQIVVDAKAPTEAYREAPPSPTPRKRSPSSKEHAAKVRGHIEALASREYWAKIEPSPSLSCSSCPATRSSPRRSSPTRPSWTGPSAAVLLATPMTLVALLKAAAYGWTQEAVSRSAGGQRLGRELYDRISGFADHLGKTAKRPSTAVKHFNCGGRLVRAEPAPRGAQVRRPGGPGTKELNEPERVELEVREVAKKS